MIKIPNNQKGNNQTSSINVQSFSYMKFWDLIDTFRETVPSDCYFKWTG